MDNFTVETSKNLWYSINVYVCLFDLAVDWKGNI
jgi:hypothetical protein